MKKSYSIGIERIKLKSASSPVVQFEKKKNFNKIFVVEHLSCNIIFFSFQIHCTVWIHWKFNWHTEQNDSHEVIWYTWHENSLLQILLKFRFVYNFMPHCRDLCKLSTKYLSFPISFSKWWVPHCDCVQRKIPFFCNLSGK